MPERKHFVRFYSPGTFFAEQSDRPIASWNVREAIILSRTIVERYSSKPWGFRFLTCLVAAPVDDGEGGKLEVEPKDVALSPLYVLGGKLLTVADVEKDPKLQILASNMRGNHWPLVVQNDNSWRHFQPFIEGAVLLNPKTGEVVATAPGAALVESGGPS